MAPQQSQHNKLFISYSRADSGAIDHLAGELAKHGFSTWVDRSRLEGGDEWASEIQTAIEESAAIIVVLSPQSLESLWVKLECSYARQFNKIFIPVLIRSVRAIPLLLSNLYYIDLQANQQEGLQQLFTRLSRLFRQPVPLAVNSTQRLKVTRIFVSHSYYDSEWSDTFVATLRQSRADVWYDRDSIQYGALVDDIQQALYDCPIFIPVLSPEAVASSWVRNEISTTLAYAHLDNQRIVLPVVCKQCKIPLLLLAFKRIADLNDSELNATDAARRVIQFLELTQDGEPDIAAPQVVSETMEETLEHGQHLTNQKQYEQALITFERATQITPQFVAAWIGKGDSLRNLRQYTAALANYERALLIDPHNDVAWNNKIALLRAMGRELDAQQAERKRRGAFLRQPAPRPS